MRYCKIIITSALVIALIFSFTFSPVAHAEPITAAVVGAAAAAAFVAWGISITAANATGQGTAGFFENNLQGFLGSSTITQKFGNGIAYSAGVLHLSEQAYNAMIDFKDYLSEKFGLSENSSVIQQGKIGDQEYGVEIPTEISGSGYSVVFTVYEESSTAYPYPGYRWAQIYQNGSTWGSNRRASAVYRFTGGANTYCDLNSAGTQYLLGVQLGLIERTTGELSVSKYQTGTTALSAVSDRMSWNEGASYEEPTYIDNTKQYDITFNDYSGTYADLPDFIYDEIADNDLTVSGEIVDIAPAPTPQPVPTFPPPPPPIPAPQDPTIPISDESSGEVNSWIAGIGETINGVIDGIEATFDSINTGILDGINSINQMLSDILSAISGAIDQALNDIKNAIGSLAGWLEDILEYLQSLGLSITDALDVLLDLISDIALEIENIAEAVIEADKQWFNDLIDAILNPFLPWINQLASGVGIWHYVVEWLQCIHEPFVFFWGVLTALGPCFPKPIYAVAAACIVIAIYKRFGR